MGQARSLSAYSLFLAKWRQRSADDVEFSQALFRIFLGTICSVYAISGTPDLTVPIYAQMASAVPWPSMYFGLLALFWSVWVARVPGNFWWRRLIALIHDIGGVVICLLLDGERVLPTFAVIISITVGNGMRFGQRWLMLGIAFSLAAIAIVTVLNPFWQAHPALVATFAIIAVLAPGYAYVIYARLGRAHLETERANLEKSRFLAQASHDLRHPLRAMGLFLARLKQSPLNSQQRDITHNIEDAVHDAGELLQRFLDVSIIEAGRLQPRHEPFEVQALFRELEEQNRLIAQRAGTEMRFVPTRHWIDADRTFIRTMLQNLISNAVRHAPGAAILIGCRGHNEQLAIWVIDRGPGLPEAVLQGWQTDPGDLQRFGQSSNGDFGIGLSIVRRLALLSQLAISVRSMSAKGTSFAIQGLVLAVPPEVQAAGPLAGLRVLVTAETPRLAADYADLLHSWACLPVLHGQSPIPADHDLAIVDLADSDLREVARQSAKQPLLVLTAQAPEGVHRLFPHRPIIVATKPVAPSELRSLLMALKSSERV